MLIAVPVITGADLLIVLDEEDKERMLALFQHPFNGKIVTLQDFVDSKY